MNLTGLNLNLKIWLGRLLLLTMMFPATSLYAMPAQQESDKEVVPCHQLHGEIQKQTEKIDSKCCCDSLHQCSGDCEHACTDCFSSFHSPFLITFSGELQQSEKLFAYPASSYGIGISSTLLLRPPRQFI